MTRLNPTPDDSRHPRSVGDLTLPAAFSHKKWTSRVVLAYLGTPVEPLPRSGRGEEFLADAIFAFLLLLLSSLKFLGPVQGCQVTSKESIKWSLSIYRCRSTGGVQVSSLQSTFRERSSRLGANNVQDGVCNVIRFHQRCQVSAARDQLD